jgi:dephospho-CoA kinase
MILVGLTGSIGMGKSTTAQMFRDAGCAVWDADAAVHRLYAAGGGAVAPIAAIWPEAVTEGAVDRGRLKTIIATDPATLHQIEAIVHPLVGQDRTAFIGAQDADIVVLDVPLLFETGGDYRVDHTVVASADAATQRARVLARGTMTAEQFDTILAKQMPDADKRARADFLVVTDTLDHARAQVQAIVATLRGKPHA